MLGWEFVEKRIELEVVDHVLENQIHEKRDWGGGKKSEWGQITLMQLGGLGMGIKHFLGPPAHSGLKLCEIDTFIP